MCDDHIHPDPVQHLVREWEHGAMNRREFFRRAAFLLGSATAAEALIASCSPAVVATPAAPTTAPAAVATAVSAPPTTAPAVVATVAAPTTAPAAVATAVSAPPTTAPASLPSSALPGYVAPSAVDFSEVNYSSGDVKMIGYLAKPKTGSGPWPAVITIHENRGITDHHQDVARRIANLGYVALCVDFLSRLGGSAKYANPPEDPTRAIGQLKQDDVNKDIVASVAYLKTLSFVKPKFGIVGFCWGGANSLMGAISSPDIVAAVIFYGRNPSNIDDVQKVNGAVLANYADDKLDTGIGGGIPALVEAMKKYNKPFDYKIYSGANHAFFNDSGPRFVEASAKDAWGRLAEFYKKQLA